MLNIDLYENTTIGRTYKTPELGPHYWDGDVKAISGNRALEELRKAVHAENGTIIGNHLSFAAMRPLPFPRLRPYPKTADTQRRPLGLSRDGEHSEVVIDMRDSLSSIDKLSDESRTYGVKTSKINLAYIQLMVGLSLSKASVEDEMFAAINHVPLRAYTYWLSTAISRRFSVTNDFQTMARIRMAVAVYFISRMNNFESLDDEAVRFVSRNLVKHLRLPDSLVNPILEGLQKEKTYTLSLGGLIREVVDHPSFTGIGDTTIVTMVSSHLIIDNNREYMTLAVDSPIVFAVLLHYSFSREFNSRSNFKSIVESGPVDNNELSQWSNDFYRNLVEARH